jgi:hypothetical protein
MRVHANPINPNLQLDAMLAAQKAAAREQAARTRRKLTESASTLVGEAEDCVVELHGREEQEGEAERQRPRRTRSGAQEEPGSEEADGSVSDWA